MVFQETFVVERSPDPLAERAEDYRFSSAKFYEDRMNLDCCAMKGTYEISEILGLQVRRPATTKGLIQTPTLEVEHILKNDSVQLIGG